MATRVTDDIPKVLSKVSIINDIALQAMAADIERLAKAKAPVKKGILYSSIRHQRVGLAHFQVGAGQEGPSEAYARYQEYGGDGRRVVKNYTKSGTGAHFLGDSGKAVAAEAPAYFKSAAKAGGF